MTRYLALFVALVLVSDATAADRVFMGYLFRRPETINYELYTHLYHAFLHADGNGKLLSSEQVPSRSLTAEAHEHGVKVILSLGGWGWDEQFAEMMTKPAAEDRYVNSVMRIIDEYDYDGIDLDWEHPDTEQEVVGFEKLARRFRGELDRLGTRKGRPMLQTIAVSQSPAKLKWLSNEILLETMDWINVMTYDYTGTWSRVAGHHSPLFARFKPHGSVTTTVDHLLGERKFPADRVAVGIPLYGRGFAVAEPYASTEGVAQLSKHTRVFSDLRQLQSTGWTRQWDDTTKNPWLVAPDNSAVFCYDDERSAALKTEWSMDRQLRGVFFWHVAADRMADGSNPVQQAARAKWRPN